MSKFKNWTQAVLPRFPHPFSPSLPSSLIPSIPIYFFFPYDQARMVLLLLPPHGPEECNISGRNINSAFNFLNVSGINLNCLNVLEVFVFSRIPEFILFKDIFHRYQILGGCIEQFLKQSALIGYKKVSYMKGKDN